ncbi:MAG: CHAT domain-containing protein [Kofleriaceae bacterium]
MRGIVVVVIACVLALAGQAGAQPKNLGTKPTAVQQAEIDKLQKELYEHQSKQAYVKAVKVARKLYDLQRKASGEDSIWTWQRKQGLASALTIAGDTNESHKLYKEMLVAAEKEYGADSQQALHAMMPMVGMLWSQNRFDELEAVYQRMLAITKKLNGDTSQEYASQLQAYGSMLFSRNEYSAAQRVYEQVIKIHEANPKAESQLASAVQMLGTLQWTLGQQAKAIQSFDRAIALSQKDPNATIMVKTATIYGVSAQYHYGGRPDLAAPLVKRVTEMYEKEIARLEKTAPDDYQLPAMLGMLGYMHRQNGDLVKAEAAFTKTIAISEKKTGYSGYEISLAEIKRAQGKHKEALALVEKLVAAMSKIAPQSVSYYNQTMADILRDMGDYKRAEALIQSHRAFLEKTYGKKHPIYGMSELSMAYIYMATGKIPLAEQLLTDSLELAEKDLSNVLKTGTEADHAAYFKRNSYQLDTAINFHLNYAAKSPTAARLAMTTLLRRKGRVLDAAAASLATIRSKLSADDKKLLDELASARAKLAKLTVAGPTATGEADYAKEVAALEDQVQKLELQIGKKSAAYRVVSQSINLAAVQKLIPKDARLVEIISFQPGDPKAAYSINPKLLPRKYVAFVVGQSGDPVTVDLGPVAPIDDAVEKFRKSVSDPDNDRALDLGRALYDLTMAKVIPKLGGVTSVLIAPDGALNVVPFSALVDDKKQFLIKKYTFTYLTSGRDLLRLNVKTKAQGGGVIFADPSFDATGKPTAPAGTTRGRRSADLASLSWQPLPGTGLEADEVTKTMKGLTVYRGVNATETTLKAVHGPKVLHLATHGFFLTDEEPAEEVGGDASRSAAPTAGPAYENPLLRSGLALAGANKLTSGDEDGIVTAMEASGLDLWGTKLVVLSACETGVGKVTNGEGVYGLRRALVIAGAESMVMTLWQVDDNATKDLMAGYYKKLNAGRPRSSALREIQLEISAREKYAHPYYWASFLPAGDNSPLTKD